MPTFIKKIFQLNLLFLISAASANVKVLTYSSLLDKGGLGEEISKQAKASGNVIEFSSSKDFSGMMGTLRRLKREGKLSSIDVVMGLNESNYTAALSEGLVQKGKVFEESTFSILINKEKFPEAQWPKTWEEAKAKLAGKILIQDPRTSEVGLTWMLNATTLHNLSLDDAKKIPKKVFPTWSASFKAFEANLAPAIWTYSTSAAYYLCSGDANAKNFVNLPLPGYPKDKNFIAVVSQKPSQDSENFVKLVLSENVQSQIWQKNWMFPSLYPAVIKKMPACFTQVWLPNNTKEVGATKPQAMLKQLDQWSL